MQDDNPLYNTSSTYPELDPNSKNNKRKNGRLKFILTILGLIAIIISAVLGYFYIFLFYSPFQQVVHRPELTRPDATNPTEAHVALNNTELSNPRLTTNTKIFLPDDLFADKISIERGAGIFADPSIEYAQNNQVLGSWSLRRPDQSKGESKVVGSIYIVEATSNAEIASSTHASDKNFDYDALVAKTRDDANKCVSEPKTGIVISQFMNICHSLESANASEKSRNVVPHILMRGYGETEGKQFILYAYIETKAAENDENSSQYSTKFIEAFKKSSIKVHNPNDPNESN